MDRKRWGREKMRDRKRWGREKDEGEKRRIGERIKGGGRVKKEEDIRDVRKCMCMYDDYAGKMTLGQTSSYNFI